MFKEKQRDRPYVFKKLRKKKEACIGGNSQASIKELTLDNNITKRKKCQAGGVLCDD